MAKQFERPASGRSGGGKNFSDRKGPGAGKSRFGEGSKFQGDTKKKVFGRSERFDRAEGEGGRPERGSRFQASDSKGPFKPNPKFKSRFGSSNERMGTGAGYAGRNDRSESPRGAAERRPAAGEGWRDKNDSPRPPRDSGKSYNERGGDARRAEGSGWRDRPASGGDRDRSSGSKPYESRGGERKPFGGRDQSGGGERKPFGDRSERKSYGDRDQSRGDDRKPYTDRGEGKTYGDRAERKPYGDRGQSRGDDRKPFADRGERRPYEDRKPFGDRDQSRGGERKPYGDRDQNRGGERTSGDRDGGNRFENRDRKPEGQNWRDRPATHGAFGRDRNADAKGYGKGEGDRKPYGDRDQGRDRKPNGDRPAYPSREGGNRREFGGSRPEGRGDRPGYDRGRGTDAPRENRFGAGRDDRRKFSDGPREAPDYNLKRYDDKARDRARRKGGSDDAMDMKDGKVRLNRYIANAGVCSRREADELIRTGEIKVNGEVVTEMGYMVGPEDTVQYGKKKLNREKMVYVLLNKPKDFITTTEDPEGRKTVMDLIAKASKERIFPVGRLDRNTTGLLLFTNDGELAQKLSHPSHKNAKIYQVEVDKPLTEADFNKILEGVELEDGKAEVDKLEVVSPDKCTIGIEVHIGKNRIVRRIFEFLGYDVVSLDRVQYAGLTKKDLPRGNWRFLNEKEVIRLKYFM